MDICYEHKVDLTFIGFSTEIAPEEGYIKCPEFWEEAYDERYAKLWRTGEPETPAEHAILDNNVGLFALCIDGKDSFRYMIAGLYEGGTVPEGFELYTLPEGDYAVFTATGPLPWSLQELNTAVWQEWFPNEGKKLGANASVSVEIYSPMRPDDPAYECGIWVPVAKKPE